MADPTERDDQPRGGVFAGRRRVIDAYKGYDRVTSIGGWLQSAFGYLSGHSLASVGLVTLLGGLAVGLVALYRPELLSTWIRPKWTETVATQKWSPSTVVFPIAGVDANGRQAAFEIVVLTKDYSWVHGSSDELALRGARLAEADIDLEVFRPEIRDGLQRSIELIAVGVASQEGAIGTETARAGKRSRTAARWIATVSPESKKIWLLNLGQYQTACATEAVADTSWQRPFVMIGIVRMDDDVDLGEALTDAMSGKSNLPAPKCYSRFELDRYPGY